MEPILARRRAARSLRLQAAGTAAETQVIVKKLRELEQSTAGISKLSDLPDDDAMMAVEKQLLADTRADTSRLAKVRATLVDAFFDNMDDEELLANLADSAKVSAQVEFFIATIPDYVDSNSGWVADEVMAGIQSAMADAGFVLDRFRLIDWVRADPHGNQVASDSRLHERQPGALIFRSTRLKSRSSGEVPPDKTAPALTGELVYYKVVLLVLETPTGGVHRLALGNAVRGMTEWRKAIGAASPTTVKIIGPTFSGSVPSLALELKHLIGPDTSISIVTGAAMADANPCIVDAIARGVSYEAAVPPTSAVMQALQSSLMSMNSRWADGRDVALLVESNTSFGAGAAPGAPLNVADNVTRSNKCMVEPPRSFQQALVYRFPLHVAQLRSDAPSTQTNVISLLPAPIVPLSFRESLPPADQLPALRPQLTSSVVEATVANMLDNIRRERLSAVGIVATDSRDILFLAKEVKKAAQHVQLFLTSAYALYLHPDYIPYTRGAVVASPYPQELHNQRLIAGKREASLTLQRQPFPSMITAGVFNATLRTLGESQKSLDYCDPMGAFVRNPSGGSGKCRPPVWISVVGEDGFWPMTRVASSAEVVPVVDGSPEAFRQSPISISSRLIAVLMLLMFSGFVFIVVLRYTKGEHRERRYQAIPVLRMLTPVASDPAIDSLLRTLVIVAGSVLATVASLFLVTFVIHWTERDGTPTRPVVAALVQIAVLGTIGAGTVALAKKAGMLDAPRRAGSPSQFGSPRRSNQVVTFCWLALIVLAVLSLLVHETAIVWNAASIETAFGVSRFVGGGMVSPAGAILCLFAGLMTVYVTGLRRLSLVGVGYTALAVGSSSFRLLTGTFQAARDAKADKGMLRVKRTADLRHFVGLLDMPMQNLRPSYLIGVAVFVLSAVWAVGSIHTVDGPWFSRFLALSSWALLSAALLLTAQASATWSVLKPKLARLGRSHLVSAFGVVGSTIEWDLTIVPPRLSDLMPLASRAERLRNRLLAIVNHEGGDGWTPNSPSRRSRQLDGTKSSEAVKAMSIRADDFAAFTASGNARSAIKLLREESIKYKVLALLQSTTWRELWRIGDHVVDVLERVHWPRCEVRDYAAEPSTKDAKSEHGSALTTSSVVERWFGECEEYLALQYAFVLRDILARTISSLFGGTLCLTLLTLAHLLYVFQGRSSLLTVDLLAAVVTGAAAIRVLVGIERDAVLSKLRLTTPGRVDFSWEFVRRVGTYGLLPLAAVIVSLFPEIGGSLSSWLESIRKLAAG